MSATCFVTLRLFDRNAGYRSMNDCMSSMDEMFSFIFVWRW